MYSKPIQNLIDSLVKIPSIGPRQAARIAFFLLKSDKSYIESFANNLIKIKEEMSLCSNCFLSSENNICKICSNPQRNKKIICIVQKEVEIHNIENSLNFNGTYLVIGEDVDILKNDTTPNSINKLIERIRNSNDKIEIIIATNPTIEGDALSEYIELKIKNENIKISKLGRGLSFGGDLEYTDKNTLKHAFENRK